MEFDTSAVFSAEAEPAAPPTDPGRESGTPERTEASGQPAPAADQFEIPGHGRLSRDEVIRGYLRQQDYTRKTQGLSQQQREYESLRQQASAMEATLVQARALLSDRARLAQYLQSLPGAEPELAADQVLTTAEVQGLLKRTRGETENAFNQRMQAMETRLVTQSYQNQYEQNIDGHLRAIGDRHPELRSVPGMELLLRQAVASQRPSSIDEALNLFDRAAAYYSNALKGVAKSVVAPPNNPLTRGIEPPNGSGTAAPGSFDSSSFSGVKDPNLRDLVMKDVERALAGR